MPTNNFQIFDENQQNMMGDGDYSVSTRRLNGVQTGIASSQLQNKTLFQTSVMANALAVFINAFGFDALDNGYTDIQSAMLEISNYIKSWSLIQSYTTAGSYTFTVPSGINELGVFVIGGGAGGCASSIAGYNYLGKDSGLGPGASGMTNFGIIKKADLQASYNLVVGSGGSGGSHDSAGSSSSNYRFTEEGSNGNSSSFGTIVANGGIGCKIGASVNNIGQATNYSNQNNVGMGAVVNTLNTGSYATEFETITYPQMCINPFDGKRLMYCGLIPNFNAVNGENTATQPIYYDDYGNYTSTPAASAYNANIQSPYDALPAIATTGTSYGCGGSSAIVETYETSSSRQYKAQGAAGCSGAVLIYAR